MKRWCLSLLAGSALASCTVNLGGDDGGTTAAAGVTGSTTAASTSGSATGTTTTASATGSTTTSATASSTGNTTASATGTGSTSGVSGTSGTGTTGSVGSTSGSTTGSVIPCAQAGATCVGLSPETCIGGTVLDANQYSCGSGFGAECCLAAGTCQTSWPQSGCTSFTDEQCPCNDGSLQLSGCNEAPDCTTACCAHGGVSDGGDAGCLAGNTGCTTANNLCCDGAACIPINESGDGVCGEADAGTEQICGGTTDGSCANGATCCNMSGIGFSYGCVVLVDAGCPELD